MIVDNLDPATDRDLRCDVCIVGAGAAGLALAREFRKSGRQIVLLESGGWKTEPRTQALYDTEQVGKPFLSAHTGRFRILGGSTTEWGGQSLPLTPLDFERREWVDHSGWPISYADLETYYDRANEFLGVDTRDYGGETAAYLGTTLPAVDRLGLDYHFSKWAPQPDVRQTYRRDLEERDDVRLILHANVTELETSEGRIVCARYQALGGVGGIVYARFFILATGGIEVARLLLASNRQRVAGLGNEHDIVGRFLQEHPATRLGTVEMTNPGAVQALFNGRRKGGKRFSARLSMKREIQEKEHLLNASAGFLFSLPEDEGFGLLRAVVKRRARVAPVRLAAETLRCFPQLLEASWLHLFAGRIFTPGAWCEVSAGFEQEPDPESRLTLSEKRDEVGMPLARLHWRLTPKTFTTAVRFSELIDQTLQEWGVGRLRAQNWLRQGLPPDGWDANFSDQNHHIGTTRMSSEETKGVVDPNLKVHTQENLFIASSSVFPTSGHSNPTLTILALSIRLADHLKGKMA